MRRYAICAALLLAVGVAQEAVAAGGWISGNELARYCNRPEGFGAGLCVGFVIGTAEAVAKPDRPYPLARACFTTPMEIGQLEAAVKKYLADHPEQLHYAAFDLVATALSQAFPCASR
jgi:hypothetical protein